MSQEQKIKSWYSEAEFIKNIEPKFSIESSIPWHQKVGTSIPFSRTVDKDPNPRIPLSVPVETPSMKMSAVFAIIGFILLGLVGWVKI